MNLPIPELVVIALLTVLEGFFVAAEIALVSVRRSRVEQLVDEGARGARRVRRLLEDPARFLAVSQLGLTFLGFFASAFAAVNLTTRLTELLAQIEPLRPAAEPIALVVVTALLALFTIVFGELVPKTLALAHPERFALTVASPIDFIGRVLGPLVAFLSGTTRRIAHLFGADVSPEQRISAEELMLIVERGGEQGVLEAEEEQMIHAVIELGQGRVHEVMVPRIAIVGLDVEAAFEDAIDTVVAEGHSRVPVYDGSIDTVVGILYAKDLLPFLKDPTGPRPALRTLLRPPVFVPESMSIDDLLHELQRRKVHIAIVLDEYGGTAGLVTIEDLIEEIVGEIQDEYDVEDDMIVKLDEDRVRLDGRASVDDLSEIWTDLDLESLLEDRDEYDTIGGLVFHRLGEVPTPGAVVTVDGLTLTVESTDGRRVRKVLVVREPRDASRYDEEADR